MRKILFLMLMAGWCLLPAMQAKAADDWTGTYTYKDKDYERGLFTLIIKPVKNEYALTLRAPKAECTTLDAMCKPDNGDLLCVEQNALKNNIDENIKPGGKDYTDPRFKIRRKNSDAIFIDFEISLNNSTGPYLPGFITGGSRFCEFFNSTRDDHHFIYTRKKR